MSADPETTALRALVLSLQAENERLRKQPSVLFWLKDELYCRCEVPTRLLAGLYPRYNVYEAIQEPLFHNWLRGTYSSSVFLQQRAKMNPSEMNPSAKDRPICIGWTTSKDSGRRWSLQVGQQTIHASEDEIHSRLQELEVGVRVALRHPPRFTEDVSHLLAAFDDLLRTVRAVIAAVPSDYARLVEQEERVDKFLRAVREHARHTTD